MISRENAIEELYRIFEHLEVPMDKRIIAEMDKDELEFVKSLPKEEQEAYKEEADTTREKCIAAIEKERLFLNENGKIEYKLRFPILTREGVLLFDKIVMQERWTAGTRRNNMKGIKAGDGDDLMGLVYAELACRCGKTRMQIEMMDDYDVKVLQAINSLFMRAD
jgi:hypothetical protein